MKYKLTEQEQELVVTVTRADDVVTCYTSDRVHMRKLDKLHQEFPDVYRLVWTDSQIMGDGAPMGKRYQFPRRYLRFGKPASEAQQAARRANAVKMRSRQ